MLRDSVLATWAAMTTYHRLGGLNSRNLVLTALEDGKFKIKVPAVTLNSRWGLFSWLAVWSYGGEERQRRPAFWSLTSRAQIVSWKPLPHDLSKAGHLPELHLPTLTQTLSLWVLALCLWRAVSQPGAGTILAYLPWFSSWYAPVRMVVSVSLTRFLWQNLIPSPLMQWFFFFVSRN